MTQPVTESLSALLQATRVDAQLYLRTIRSLVGQNSEISARELISIGKKTNEPKVIFASGVSLSLNAIENFIGHRNFSAALEWAKVAEYLAAPFLQSGDYYESCIRSMQKLASTSTLAAPRVFSESKESGVKLLEISSILVRVSDTAVENYQRESAGKQIDGGDLTMASFPSSSHSGRFGS